MNHRKSTPVFRRLLSVMLALCLSVGLCVPALADAEAEGNNSLETANPISVNTEVSGSISSSSDVDWYKFELPEDGYISLTFDHDFVDSSRSYWKTSFYTSSNYELDYWTWSGNATTAKTGNKNGVPAGTYYLRVADDYFSPETYRFTVNYTPSDSWEREFNETFVTANNISTDVEISGTIRNSSDVDWYRFELPSDGYISITFDHDFVDSSRSYWKTSFYTSSNSELDYWTWSGNATIAGTGNKVGVPAGTYYLRIVDDYHSAKTYRFTVNYTRSDVWEKEFNETIVTANEIDTDVEISGTIRNSSDVDWYKFDLPADGSISLTFDHDFVDSSRSYWKTSFYTSANKELSSWRWSGNATSAGTGSAIGVPAGTYYLRIVDDYHSTKTYRFTVNYTPSDSSGNEDPEAVYASEISLSKTSLSLTNGESSTLTATVWPSDATDKTVTWRSGNTRVATVKNGRVIGVGEGTTTVTASCGNVSASCTVVVKTDKVEAAEVFLNKTSLSLTKGGSSTLTATVWPSDTTDKAVTWHSANTRVATVKNGKVTGVGKGTTTITASCGNVSASCVVSVEAEEDEKPQTQGKEIHFDRVNVYFQDQFTDVPANQWYTNNVADAFELGLMKGNSKTTFNPYGYVTIAEAVTMAARIHSIYMKDGAEFASANGEWYQAYLDYAYEKGIISLAYYNCDVNHKATRAQFATIFANSLPAEALAVINSVADGAIPDVSMRDSYASSVYKLYRAGILTGGDANGTFSPTTYISRAEAAAIVSRMGESDSRVSITL